MAGEINKVAVRNLVRSPRSDCFFKIPQATIFKPIKTRGDFVKKQVAKKSENFVPAEIIQKKIYFIRGHKVMFDVDLARLYSVPTKRFNEQVKRNLKRFPSDFMFQLTRNEYDNLRSQFATSSWGGRRYLPYVFTDYGVAMLSSVLNSDRAIEVNIQIMRVFTKLREMMISHKDLARKIEDMEHKFQERFKEQDQKIVVVFNAIRDLLADKKEVAKKRGPMGFLPYKQPKIASKLKSK